MPHTEDIPCPEIKLNFKSNYDYSLCEYSEQGDHHVIESRSLFEDVHCKSADGDGYEADCNGPGEEADKGNGHVDGVELGRSK